MRLLPWRFLVWRLLVWRHISASSKSTVDSTSASSTTIFSAVKPIALSDVVWLVAAPKLRVSDVLATCLFVSYLPNLVSTFLALSQPAAG